MRRPAATAIAVAASCLLLGTAACSGDSKDGATTTTAAATSSSTPTTGTTTEVPGTSATTAPPTSPTTSGGTTSAPDTATTIPPTRDYPTDAGEYAAQLVAAWTAGDKSMALDYAQPGAVDTLFAFEAGGEEGSTAVWTLTGPCQGAAGSSYCTFGAGGDPEIQVRMVNEQLGYPQAISEVKVTS